jgi:hypothetical protein
MRPPLKILIPTGSYRSSSSSYVGSFGYIQPADTIIEPAEIYSAQTRMAPHHTLDLYPSINLSIYPSIYRSPPDPAAASDGSAAADER